MLTELLPWILGALGVASLALGWYLDLGWRQAAKIERFLDPPDPREAWREAAGGFFAAPGRVWGAIGRASLVLAGYLLLWTLVFSGVFALGMGRHEESVRSPGALFALLTQSALCRYSLLALLTGWGAAALMWGVIVSRLVQRIREGRILSRREIARELDSAMGVAGFTSTLGIAFTALILLALWFPMWASAGWIIEGYVREQAGLAGAPGAAGLAAGLAVGALGIWALGIVPCLYTFAILATRDPGWLSAMEASIGLARFHRRTHLAVTLRVTALVLSVYGIPLAAWMLLALVERQRPLLALYLRERRLEDLLKDLEAEGVTLGDTVSQFETLLAEGRYLDALNTLQILAFHDPMNVQTLEGIARAQLMIGNLAQGREAVERILRLDSSNALAARLMSEIEDGLWSEGGALLTRAQAHCTQRLGRGVTLEDTLDPRVKSELAGIPLPPPRSGGSGGSSSA